MPGRYRETYFTPEVLAAQQHYFGKSRPASPQPELDPLTKEEIDFIARRDSFYMATVTSDGWPYVQHRGGTPGFLKVLNPRSLGFADYSGNRQMISTGNLATNPRVALFFMDYPHRERLKIIGHARVIDARADPQLVRQLADESEQANVERVLLIDVLSFDWNCSQYVTPRYTAAEIGEATALLQRRIEELEKQLEKCGCR